MRNCPDITILINLFGQDQGQGSLGGHGGHSGRGGWGGQSGRGGQGGRGRQGGQGGQDGQGKGNFVWNSKVAAVPEGYMSVPDGYLYKG